MFSWSLCSMPRTVTAHGVEPFKSINSICIPLLVSQQDFNLKLCKSMGTKKFVKSKNINFCIVPLKVSYNIGQN